MHEHVPERSTAALIRDIGKAWRRCGPESDEFEGLVLEAVSRPDACDLLHRSCLALGDDSQQLASDMRTMLAHRAVPFVMGEMGEVWFATSLFAIPVVGTAIALSRVAAEPGITAAVRSALAGTEVFPPGSQFGLLERPLTAHDIANISPDMLHELRELLTMVAMGDVVSPPMAGKSWRDMVEEAGFHVSTQDAQDVGYRLGYILGVRVTHMGEYDPPIPQPEDLEKILRRAFNAFQDVVQESLDAAGVEAVILPPSTYQESTLDGLVGYAMTMLSLEFAALNRGQSEPDIWDEIHLYAWDATLFICGEMDGVTCGPVGVPAHLVSNATKDFVALLEDHTHEFVCHEAEEAPCLPRGH